MTAPISLGVAAALTLFPFMAAAAPFEVRWVAYVRSSGEAADTGSLAVVRSDGRERRVLLDRGVIAADLGPSGEVFAAREVRGESGPALPASEIVRVPVTGGAAAPVGGDEGAHYLGVAASAGGEIASFRQVTRPSKAPGFLSTATAKLSRTTVPVLVPEERPAGTQGAVTDAGPDFYQVLFTNDPRGELAHAEQVNVLVSGTLGDSEVSAGMVTPASVRGSEAEFFCGASACFLTWRELGATYTVGEFGAPDAAIEFAESLVPIEEIAGPYWRDGADYPAPELITRGRDGRERTLESVNGFCECGFMPLDWSPDGKRLLVLSSAEGYTTLQEYAADGPTEPSTVAEGSVFGDAGGVILDAGYGPRELLLVIGGEGGPPGTLQTRSGRTLAEGVRAFDTHGSTLAYVTAAGEVRVRDLRTGDERRVARGAIDVSVAPDPLRPAEVRRDRSEPGDERTPLSPTLILSIAAGVIGAGIAWILRGRIRR